MEKASLLAFVCLAVTHYTKSYSFIKQIDDFSTPTKYLGLVKRIKSGSGDVWIKSFWNNKTYILYWNDLNAISGDEIYSVWKVDTLKKSASSCCTNITQTFCDLSSIFKHDLNAGYDIEIYSVGNTSNFSAELIDYYPWLETSKPLPIFNVTQKDNIITLTPFFTMEIQHLLLNESYSYMVRYKSNDSILNNYTVECKNLQFIPFSVNTSSSEKTYCVSMAFKDDSIPEGYPQNGQYNWTKDKCTSKIWIKSKKVYNNSNKSIICWSIFIVAVILLGFVVFIYFVKYVAKNIEVYKTVHSSVIPKQLELAVNCKSENFVEIENSEELKLHNSATDTICYAMINL